MQVSLQIGLSDPKAYDIPEQCEFQDWTDITTHAEGEVCVRVVDKAESARLNEQYRQRPYASNVLSFAFNAPIPLENPLLGDIVIAAPLILEEAVEQEKPIKDHWAHIFIHGLLHLQGYDHQDDEQARQMEACEIKILNRLGFANPYIILNE